MAGDTETRKSGSVANALGTPDKEIKPRWFDGIGYTIQVRRGSVPLTNPGTFGFVAPIAPEDLSEYKPQG